MSETQAYMKNIFVFSPGMLHPTIFYAFPLFMRASYS
jgi:hypothetical protein